MTRRLAAEVDGSIFVLRGWQAHRLAIEAGLRPTYNGVRQGWVADTAKLSTFEAYCAHRHVHLEITGVAEPAPPAASTPPGPTPEPSLFDLLDGGR